jgi:CheY-like chemotaxis protein
MSKFSALIIEDTAELAEIFSDILRVEGGDTEVVCNGHNALIRLDEVCPDVILLDMHLPGVSGFDILKRIRADARLANSKVIVVTADGLMVERVEDMADLVLLKPVTYLQISRLSLRLLADLSPRTA